MSPCARPLALALGLALAAGACSGESGAAPAPALRFECSEGCGTYKTVRPGETPPPCCGAAMERPD